MRPKDVAQAVSFVTSHPVAGQRYGDTIKTLASTWLRLLGRKAFCAIVLEEFDGDRVQMVGAAARVFVSDDFLRELKTPPFFWIAPELANRLACSNSPLLSDNEVAAGNTSGGLNLVLCHLSIDPEEAKRPEMRTQISGVLFEIHRGFLLKELIGLQVTFPEEAYWSCCNRRCAILLPQSRAWQT
jgi:hypothetical protein